MTRNGRPDIIRDMSNTRTTNEHDHAALLDAYDMAMDWLIESRRELDADKSLLAQTEETYISAMECDDEPGMREADRRSDRIEKRIRSLRDDIRHGKAEVRRLEALLVESEAR